MARRLLAVAVAAALLAVSACGTSASNPGDETASSPATTVTVASTPPPSTPVAVAGEELGFVTSVTDGDTIRVDHDGRADVPVRLIGINAPESGECFAVEAHAALAAMVATTRVRLVRDESDADRFGRLLRYVYLPDGTFVNEELVRGGFALAREYPPDTAQSAVLAAAEVDAENAGAGLWAADACGAPTSATLIITHVEFDPPGDDHQNPNGEWVTIENGGSARIDMGGWILKDESAIHRYGFPSGFSLAPGGTVRVFTGCGSDSSTELYWCNDLGAVWNNAGDTAFLLDPNGNIHVQYGY
jgi:micrococcal nuclease